MIRYVIGFLLSSVFLVVVPNTAPATDGPVDYAHPQKILEFADYLYEEGDYSRAAGEYQRYLFSTAHQSAEVLLRTGIAYQKGDRVQRAIDTFEHVIASDPGSLYAERAMYCIGQTYARQSEYDRSIDYLQTNIAKITFPELQWQVHHLLGASQLKLGRWSDGHQLAIQMDESFSEPVAKRVSKQLAQLAAEGKGLPHRSPLVAGILSAVLPGGGKIYTGRYADGVYSMLTVLGTGWYTRRKFQHDGTSTGAWLFAGLSGLLYVGNIYGSVLSAQLHNDEMEARFVATIPLPTWPEPARLEENRR